MNSKTVKRILEYCIANPQYDWEREFSGSGSIVKHMVRIKSMDSDFETMALNEFGAMGRVTQLILDKQDQLCKAIRAASLENEIS